MNLKFVALQLFILSVLAMEPARSFAQADTLPAAVTFNGGVDLMSRYIWRGQEYGQSPSIQPGASITWKNFTLGAWGAYKVTGPGVQETDFYLSKTIGHFTLSVWDYWTFCDTAAMDFFNYNPRTTSHLLEAGLLISGGDILPFNLLGCYFFYGADTTRSIYLELQFVHSFRFVDLQVFAGFQPKGEYYAPIPTFVNLGFTVMKKIPVTQKWSLPVSISLITNPYRRSVYLVAGITI